MLLLTWFDIGLLPILFMSFGDAVTGFVRAFTQRRMVKSWDGTVAMFLISVVFAVWRLGSGGILVAAIVSLVERNRVIDDNIAIPIVAAFCMIVANLF